MQRSAKSSPAVPPPPPPPPTMYLNQQSQDMSGSAARYADGYPSLFSPVISVAGGQAPAYHAPFINHAGQHDPQQAQPHMYVHPQQQSLDLNDLGAGKKAAKKSRKESSDGLPLNGIVGMNSILAEKSGRKLSSTKKTSSSGSSKHSLIVPPDGMMVDDSMVPPPPPPPPGQLQHHSSSMGSTVGLQEQHIGDVSSGAQTASTSQFVCNICHKDFVTKGSLKTHSRVHTGERPYACPTCSKSFTQQANCARHIRLMHPDQPGVLPVKVSGDKLFAKKKEDGSSLKKKKKKDGLQGVSSTGIPVPPPPSHPLSSYSSAEVGMFPPPPPGTYPYNFGQSAINPLIHRTSSNESFVGLDMMMGQGIPPPPPPPPPAGAGSKTKKGLKKDQVPTHEATVDGIGSKASKKQKRTQDQVEQHSVDPSKKKKPVSKAASSQSQPQQQQSYESDGYAGTNPSGGAANVTSGYGLPGSSYAQSYGDWTARAAAGGSSIASPNMSAAATSSTSGTASGQVLPQLSLDWMRSKSPVYGGAQGGNSTSATGSATGAGSGDWMIRSKSPMIAAPSGSSGLVGHHHHPGATQAYPDITMFHHAATSQFSSDPQGQMFNPVMYEGYQQQQLGSPSNRAAAAAAAHHQQQQAAVHHAAQAAAAAQAAKFHQQANHEMYMPNSSSAAAMGVGYGGYYPSAAGPAGAGGQPMTVMHHPYAQGFEDQSYSMLDFPQHLDLMFDPSMPTSM